MQYNIHIYIHCYTCNSIHTYTHAIHTMHINNNAFNTIRYNEIQYVCTCIHTSICTHNTYIYMHAIQYNTYAYM